MSATAEEIQAAVVTIQVSGIDSAVNQVKRHHPEVGTHRQRLALSVHNVERGELDKLSEPWTFHVFLNDRWDIAPIMWKRRNVGEYVTLSAFLA